MINLSKVKHVLALKLEKMLEYLDLADPVGVEVRGEREFPFPYIPKNGSL